MQFWLITTIWLTPIVLLVAAVAFTTLHLRRSAADINRASDLRSVAMATKLYASRHDGKLPPTGLIQITLINQQLAGAEWFDREPALRFVEFDGVMPSRIVPVVYEEKHRADSLGTLVGFSDGTVWHIDEPRASEVLQNRLTYSEEFDRQLRTK